MLDAFIPVVLILAAGLIYSRIPGVVPAAEVRRTIGSIVLNVFLPALTFISLYSTPINHALWTVPLISAIVTSTCLAIAYVFYAHILRKGLSRSAVGSLLLAAAWCNATYLGLPIVTSLIGPHVRQVPIIYDLLALTPLLFIAGTIIGVEYGDGDAKHSISASLKQLLRLPPLWAAAAGLTCNALHIAIPTSVVTSLEIIGRTVPPLMIFSVGLALRLPSVRRLPLIAPAVVIRLAVSPLLGWGLASVLIHDGDIFKATVLESAMPTMMLTMVFAERYGLDCEVLAEAVILSTICSMLTLPLTMQLL